MSSSSPAPVSMGPSDIMPCWGWATRASASAPTTCRFCRSIFGWYQNVTRLRASAVLSDSSDEDAGGGASFCSSTTLCRAAISTGFCSTGSMFNDRSLPVLRKFSKNATSQRPSSWMRPVKPHSFKDSSARIQSYGLLELRSTKMTSGSCPSMLSARRALLSNSMVSIPTPRSDLDRSCRKPKSESMMKQTDVRGPGGNCLSATVSAGVPSIVTPGHRNSKQKGHVSFRVRISSSDCVDQNATLDFAAVKNFIISSYYLLAVVPPFSHRLHRPAVARPAGHGGLASRPSSRCDPPAGPRQQPERDRYVYQVPDEAVGEGGAVGAGEIEDHARHPAAERHPEQRRHQRDAEPRAGLLRREIFAHDDGVHRHDAALEQTEQSGDHVERGQSVEEEIQKQRHALQDGAQQQRRHAADAIRDEARGDAADNPKGKHQ